MALITIAEADTLIANEDFKHRVEFIAARVALKISDDAAHPNVTNPQAGRMAIITIVCENALTAVTITPGVGSQINNAGVGVAYAAPAGGTISLKSRNGLSWLRGRP